jgi:hypothetical protein
MSNALVVVHPFADYAKGDRITDADTIKNLLENHAHRVVTIVIPDDAPAGRTKTGERG